MGEEFVIIAPSSYNVNFSEDFRKEVSNKVAELFEVGINNITEKLKDLNFDKKLADDINTINILFRPKIVVSVWEEEMKEKDSVLGQYDDITNTIYIKTYDEDDFRYFEKEREIILFHEMAHWIFSKLSSEYINKLIRKLCEKGVERDYLRENIAYKAERFLEEFFAELTSLLLAYERYGDNIFDVGWYGFSQYYSYILNGVFPFDYYYAFSDEICEWSEFRKSFVCTTQTSYYKVGRYDPLRSIIENNPKGIIKISRNNKDYTILLPFVTFHDANDIEKCTYEDIIRYAYRIANQLFRTLVVANKVGDGWEFACKILKRAREIKNEKELLSLFRDVIEDFVNTLITLKDFAKEALVREIEERSRYLVSKLPYYSSTQDRLERFKKYLLPEIKRNLEIYRSIINLGSEYFDKYQGRYANLKKFVEHSLKDVGIDISL